MANEINSNGVMNISATTEGVPVQFDTDAQGKPANPGTWDEIINRYAERHTNVVPTEEVELKPSSDIAQQNLDRMTADNEKQEVGVLAAEDEQTDVLAKLRKEKRKLREWKERLQKEPGAKRSYDRAVKKIKEKIQNLDEQRDQKLAELQERMTKLEAAKNEAQASAEDLLKLLSTTPEELMEEEVLTVNLEEEITEDEVQEKGWFSQVAETLNRWRIRGQTAGGSIDEDRTLADITAQATMKDLKESADRAKKAARSAAFTVGAGAAAAASIPGSVGIALASLAAGVGASVAFGGASILGGVDTVMRTVGTARTLGTAAAEGVVNAGLNIVDTAGGALREGTARSAAELLKRSANIPEIREVMGGGSAEIAQLREAQIQTQQQIAELTALVRSMAEQNQQRG